VRTRDFPRARARYNTPLLARACSARYNSETGYSRLGEIRVGGSIGEGEGRIYDEVARSSANKEGTRLLERLKESVSVYYTSNKA
jgi:hypothetical protein